jgi:hypothetical protein
MLRPRTAVRWVSYRRRGSFADRKSRPESPKRLLANTSHCGDPRSVKLINGWEEALSFWLHLCGFGGACGATVNPHNNKEAATMVSLLKVIQLCLVLLSLNRSRLVIAIRFRWPAQWHGAIRCWSFWDGCICKCTHQT